MLQNGALVASLQQLEDALERLWKTKNSSFDDIKSARYLRDTLDHFRASLYNPDITENFDNPIPLTVIDKPPMLNALHNLRHHLPWSTGAVRDVTKSVPSSGTKASRSPTVHEGTPKQKINEYIGGDGRGMIDDEDSEDDSDFALSEAEDSAKRSIGKAPAAGLYGESSTNPLLGPWLILRSVLDIVKGKKRAASESESGDEIPEMESASQRSSARGFATSLEGKSSRPGL